MCTLTLCIAIAKAHMQLILGSALTEHHWVAQGAKLEQPQIKCTCATDLNIPMTLPTLTNM